MGYDVDGNTTHGIIIIKHNYFVFIFLTGWLKIDMMPQK